MAKKIFRLGMLAMVLVFGMTVNGCAVTPNFYDFGDVSDGNYALIQVTPLLFIGGEIDERIPFSHWVRINGEGGRELHPAPQGFFQLRRSIVRVTPGEYTFTIIFNPGRPGTGLLSTRDEQISVTFNVEAGMGYTFQFMATSTDPVYFNPLATPISVGIVAYESPIDENGDFGRTQYFTNTHHPPTRNMREVARNHEIIRGRSGNSQLFR